ncbi:hypothetical protein DSM104443_01726 [Usitatibacter rugosus]|uniref:Esterase/lipase superfamily enzyme n=1 Tax=Usitatibacter rugosus TaxID=2732067 RepID=A0A6M4GTJ4_9PROT|nr:alpha/beta hydrolase [Usitatibacter rugosus]QJR10659.1 hypothetical protein DSM104443_01726 [Usitatibacter rugosus]
MRKLLTLLASLLVAGCATTPPHVMPTPAMFKDPRLDFTKADSPALRSTRLPVFYATTRAAARPGTEGHYVNSPGEGTTLGVANVRLGEPGWTWDDLIASDISSSVDKIRIGAVESVQEIATLKGGAEPDEGERRFIAAIDAQIARSNNKEVVMYLHGYRVEFDEVAVQMGSFAHFLGHSAMVTFQWPTGMMFWNYVTDCPRAERYIPDIERTIALLAHTKATKINLLAYSCGSPLMAAALAKLRARHPGENRDQLQKRYRIGNVIFAASDVDLKTFASEYVPPASDLSQQLIIYASRNDRALGFSTLIAGASRLGRPDINDLSTEEIERLAGEKGLQFIDISDVRGAHEMGGMKGHGYWYANDWISTDITLSLRHPVPPEKRCLVPKGKQKKVWVMRDDYPKCVADEFLVAFPALRRTP